MNELAKLFKPEDVQIELGGEKYRLVFDLNSLCELEKQYESVDYILHMLLGTTASPDLDLVSYKGEKVEATDIMVGTQPLTQYIAQNETEIPKAKHSDTLNLLYAGLLHDHTTFDEDGDVTGYTISRGKIGSLVTFKNLREVNAQIVMAILRDLLPPVEDEEAKNEEAPVQTPLKMVNKTEA